MMARSFGRLALAAAVAALAVRLAAEARDETGTGAATARDRAALLSYLERLPQRFDGRLIAGQQAGPGDWLPQGYDQHVRQLAERGGCWVALVGADYGYGPSSRWTWDLAIANRVLIDHWRSGGLVTVSWHARNPWTGGSAWDREQADLGQLVVPDGRGAAAWLAQLDEVAGALSELRDQGVVVLWRPFHEMNGGWFWWGIRAHPGDPEPFKRLWRHMHDRFTRVHGLDNLIWVYSASFRPDPVARYPGDAYVDVVAEDNYAAALELPGYEQLTALAKPYAIGEFGPKPADGRFDWSGFLATARARYPRAVYFLAWNATIDGKDWSLAGNLNADRLLDDPWVVTLDELDWRGSGR